MRYYLDTNILIFILSKQNDEIKNEVRKIIYDYSSILYVSSIVLQELLLLYRIRKIDLSRYKSEKDILADIKEIGIEVVFFNEHHLSAYASLRIIEGHKDMNDHSIIAQAISDKIPLISSDTKFKEYVSQGLNFIYNKR